MTCKNTDCACGTDCQCGAHCSCVDCECGAPNDGVSGEVEPNTAATHRAEDRSSIVVDRTVNGRDYYAVVNSQGEVLAQEG